MVSLIRTKRTRSPSFMDGLSLRKLTPVEAPDVPLHIAGEVKDDFASRWPAVHSFVERAEIGIRQHATTVSIQTISWIGQPWRSVHCNHDHFRANVKGHLSFLCFRGASHRLGRRRH